MASNLESKSVMLKKNVGKCTHYLAETKVKDGSRESIIHDMNAQYWVKRNQGISYFGMISLDFSTKSVQQIRDLLMIYKK